MRSIQPAAPLGATCSRELSVGIMHIPLLQSWDVSNDGRCYKYFVPTGLRAELQSTIATALAKIPVAFASDYVVFDQRTCTRFAGRAFPFRLA